MSIMIWLLYFVWINSL